MARTKKSLQSDVPSLVIDIGEIERLAEEADRLATMEPDEKPTRKKKEAAPADSKRETVQAQPIEPISDPEFDSMISWGIGSGVDVMKAKFDWTEPGIHWRTKVGVCVSRLIQRLTGSVKPGPLADALTLTGYVALWTVPNVAFGESQNKNTNGDHGERKDVQAPGTSQS